MPLVVVEQNGTRRVDASLEMSAKVQWHPDRSISIELGIGKLSIPADPALAFRLGLFVAGLIAFLNLMILSRIRIPPLELFGVELAPRIPTITTHVAGKTFDITSRELALGFVGGVAEKSPSSSMLHSPLLQACLAERVGEGAALRSSLRPGPAPRDGMNSGSRFARSERNGNAKNSGLPVSIS